MGRGSTSPASFLIFSQRFTEGKETPKTPATSLRSMPRSTASNTLSLRSFEYAFMPTSIHEAQPTRNPLSDGPDTGLIESLRLLGLPVLAFGFEGSTGSLARALDAGADDTISLGEPVNDFICKAEQLVG